jgi:hypothetical protein
MKGAREYAGLFKTGQYGKLYITSFYHARGKTFRIQVLPEGEKAKSNGPGNPCLNKDAVTVYGIVLGQSGWNEKYGWLYKGPWQEDFYKLVEKRKKEIENREEIEKKRKQEKEEAERQRIKNLLDQY